MSSEIRFIEPPGLFQRTFQQYWVAMLVGWLLGTLIVCGLIHDNIDPTYQAVSLLRAEPDLSTIYGIRTSVETVETFVQNQVQLLKSPNVLKAAAANPKIAKLPRIQRSSNAVEELKRVVDVSIPTGTYLIEVSMTSRNAEETAPIVNAVVEAYLDAAERQLSLARSLIRRLEKYSAELQVRSDEVEHRWKTLTSKGDVDIKAIERDRNKIVLPAIIEKLTNLNDQILQNDFRLAVAEGVLDDAKTDALKATQKPSPAQTQERIDRMIERKLQSDPEFSTLALQMMKAGLKVKANGRGGSPSDSISQSEQKRLDECRKKYDEFRLSRSLALRKEIEQAGPNGITPEQELRELTASLEQLQSRKAADKKTADELDSQKGQELNEFEIQFVIDSRFNIANMQEQVRDRLELLRSETRSETDIRRVSEAIVPTRPIRDPRLTLLAIAPLVTLLFAVGTFVGINAWLGPEKLAGRS